MVAPAPDLVVLVGLLITKKA